MKQSATRCSSSSHHTVVVQWCNLFIWTNSISTHCSDGFYFHVSGTTDSPPNSVYPFFYNLKRHGRAKVVNLYTPCLDRRGILQPWTMSNWVCLSTKLVPEEGPSQHVSTLSERSVSCPKWKERREIPLKIDLYIFSGVPIWKISRHLTIYLYICHYVSTLDSTVRIPKFECVPYMIAD